MAKTECPEKCVKLVLTKEDLRAPGSIYKSAKLNCTNGFCKILPISCVFLRIIGSYDVRLSAKTCDPQLLFLVGEGENQRTHQYHYNKSLGRLNSPEFSSDWFLPI